MATTEGPITALLNQDDLFVQVLTPKTPPANQIGQSGVPFPKAAHFISADKPFRRLAAKFAWAEDDGATQGQPADAAAIIKVPRSVLYFGELH